MFSTSVPPTSETHLIRILVLAALVVAFALLIIIMNVVVIAIATSRLTNKALDHHVDRPAQGEICIGYIPGQRDIRPVISCGKGQCLSGPRKCRGRSPRRNESTGLSQGM